MEGARHAERATVYLIPLASRLHQARVFEPSKHARELLESAGLKVFGTTNPAMREEDVPKFPSEEYDAVVLFIASGGTSNLAYKLAAGKPYFIWGYDEVNSLASTLSAREKLKAARAWMGEIVYNSLDEAPSRIVNYAKASKAVKSLKGMKLALVGDDDFFREKEAELKNLVTLTGIEPVHLPLVELLKTTASYQDEEASKVMEERLTNYTVVEPSKKDLVKAAKMYLALKAIVEDNNVSGITLDCYKVVKRTGVSTCLAFALLNDDGNVAICEGDLEAATLMMIFRKLAGISWMGNLVQMSRDLNVVTVAHCEAPLSLAEPAGTIILRSQFESDESVGLDVPLRREPVTLANLQFQPLQLTVAKGEIMESQIGKFSLCRTQAMIRLAGKVEDLLAHTGNHHVIAYGDWIETLRCVADRLKIPFVNV